MHQAIKTTCNLLLGILSVNTVFDYRVSHLIDKNQDRMRLVPGIFR